MAWKDTLLDASFRGVPFDCQRTADSIEREVARYAYPHVDGEDIEDLGQKARDVTITAIFFGDDYETQMKRLLGALAQKGPGELIHPVFGSLPAMQFLGGNVSHDADNPDACLFEMRFAASTPGNPFFVEQAASQKADATAQLADTAQRAGTSMFAMALGALKQARAGLRRLNALRDMLTGTLGPIKALVTGFRGVALDYLNFPTAFASDLIGLVSGMADFRSFDAGIVMSDWNGLAEQMATIVKLPAASANGERLTIPGTPAVIAPAEPSAGQPSDPAAPWSPPRAGLVAVDPADVQLATAFVKTIVATVTARVASDVLANEADTPTLRPELVEQIADDTRARIQEAIEAVRALLPLDDARPVIEPLKDVALSIQELAIKVIDTLPPIVERTVPAPSNLTLLAFRWYGDAARSAELLRLNPGVRNPNFIERGEVLRGFAQ